MEPIKTELFIHIIFTEFMKELSRFFAALCQLLVLPLEMVFHRNMGERYIAGFKVIISWTLVFFLFLTNSFFGRTDEETYVAMAILFLVGIVMAFRRKVDLDLSYMEDRPIHSYYNGSPKMLSKYNEQGVKMYYEPLILLVLGLTIYLLTLSTREMIYGNDILGAVLPVFGSLGLYFTFGALVLLVKEQIAYALGRSKYLDAQDEHIESKQLKRALNPDNLSSMDDLNSGKRKLDAALMQGFSVPGPVTSGEATKKSIEEIYQGLNPNLQKLLTKEKANDEPTNKVKEAVIEKEKDRDER